MGFIHDMHVETDWNFVYIRNVLFKKCLQVKTASLNRHTQIHTIILIINVIIIVGLLFFSTVSTGQWFAHWKLLPLNDYLFMTINTIKDNLNSPRFAFLVTRREIFFVL